MRLKKINAILSLLSVLLLAVHVGYNIFSYITFYYNPTLKLFTAIPFMVVVCGHAVCGMCSVFLASDGTDLITYRKQNRGTVIQRVSASLIFPLLILHINAFNLLKTFSSNGQLLLFFLVVILQALFFAIIALHIATSFSKAFITLGLLSDMDKKKRIDLITRIVCVLSCAAAVYSVVQGEIFMFLLM